MKELTHISIFSGIGGNSIAASWAGFRDVLFCEIDPFCQAVLRKHFPGVPIIEDVHDVTREKVEQAIADSGQFCSIGITADGERGNGQQPTRPEVGPRNSTGNRITLLTAGVPCQPASTAGKRRGKNDDRWLWPEAIRVLSELQPDWAVFENPAGIISLDEFGGITDMESEAANQIPDEYPGGLDELCADIEKRGYEVQPVLIPACAVNAYHRRDRVFVICHSASTGLGRRGEKRGLAESLGQGEAIRAGSSSSDPRSDRSEARLPEQAQREEGNSGIAQYGCGEPLRSPLGLPDWAGGEMGQPAPLTEFERPGREWEALGDVRGVASRLSGRMDGLRIPVRDRVKRLKALGNAIVPQQVYPIFKAIADIEVKDEC